jgi:NAD(P) transhydrogenase
MPDRFDLVVLGAGPAGEKGAAQAAYFDRQVAIVERQPAPGGAAVHTGTLPSKTLRETALFLSGYRQRDLYGVAVHVSDDLAVSKLIERKDAVRELETARIRHNLDRHGIEQIRGTARFVDTHTVDVSREGVPRRLSAEVFLIATGSRPFRPPGIPYEDPDVVDSDTILRIDRVPASLTVLGGGIIGCEYASMFAALGVRVHLIEGRSGLLPFLDPEMGEHLRQAMTALGVDFRFGTRATKVRREAGSGLVCTLTTGDRVASEKVLVASGRVGDTETLDPASVGVATDERGHVLVDDDYRTTVAGIYAAGDVIGFPALASTSMEQARVALCHAFGFPYKREVSSLLPYGVYTIPEVSCVGLGEEEARRRGLDVVVGRAYFRENARGQIVGDVEGMVKLVLTAPRERWSGAIASASEPRSWYTWDRRPSCWKGPSRRSSRWCSTIRR